MVPVKPVHYRKAAYRHLLDGHLLQANGRLANAGQLFGFSVECGIKAILVASGVPQDADGGVDDKNPFRKAFRQHLPLLTTNTIAFGHLIPDGPRVTRYLSMLSSLSGLANWSTDHRYYSESATPLHSVAVWEFAALEVNEMLDQASLDGVV